MEKRRQTPRAGRTGERRKTLATPRRGKAATQDVLGNVSTEFEPPRKWQRQFKRLMDLRSDLVNRKVNLVADAREEQPGFSLHMADAGTDHYDRDFALSMISSEQNALYEIENALNRIKNGTYGLCELTGKRIESGRLEAVPWARFSAEAEKELEQQGAVRRAQLGQRQEVPRATGAEETREEEEET